MINISQRISLMMFVLLLSYHSRVTNGQTYSFSQPATVPSSVCEGSDVTLQCVIVINVDNATTVRNSVWSRNSSGIVTVISIQTPIPNHEVVFNFTNRAFTDLVITNVTLEDDNTVYSCSASGTPITSSVVLNVTGIPAVENLMAVDNCTSVTVSWDEGSCKDLLYNVSLISRDDGVTLQSVITDATSHTFTGVETPNEMFDVSVTALNGNARGPSRTSTAEVCVPNVTNLTSTTFSVDTITVTWDVANSPNCGAVYYLAMISSDEHYNITYVTELTATFPDLMSDTNYNITVTPYCRVIAGNNATVTTVRTSSPVPTQSNNPTNNPTNPSTCVSESDDELSTGVAVAISIVVTFIITLVVTALITLIITSLYYKHLFKKLLVRQEGDSHALTEDIKSNDPAAYATTRANITMDTNPAYGTATAIKMDTNPAYATTTT